MRATPGAVWRTSPDSGAQGVIPMAATRIMEEERGIFLGNPRNPHQGYYAGDFSGPPTPLNGFAAIKCGQSDPSESPNGGWF